MIGGFILAGTEPKRLLLRGIGPSLIAAGVHNALADHTLQLLNRNGVEVASNDNWGENSAAVEATGAAPTDSSEAALVATLAPGAYTAIVRGANGTTGVGLVEAYDLDPGQGKLANISTRGSGGSTGGSTRMLLRGIGPSLSTAGLTGVLANPSLELRDANGALVGFNHNWRDTQEAEIEATGIPPSQDQEAALLQLLPPGGYTAILRGEGDTSGVGLVEVYWLE